MQRLRAWTKGTNHLKEFSEGLFLELGEVSLADGHPWEAGKEPGAAAWFGGLTLL